MAADDLKPTLEAVADSNGQDKRIDVDIATRFRFHNQ